VACRTPARGGTPEEVLTHPARLAQVVEQVQGGLSIARDFTYTDEPPFAFPLATFAGERDQEWAPPTFVGWREHTVSTYASFCYPEAGHLDLLQVPAIRSCLLIDVMTTLRQWLEVAA
jgi:surfactin synthase thioesterase subunit